MNEKNRNKTVLITGASKGIGYELAKLFAADGYDLVLIARSKELLYEIKENFETEYKSEVLVIVKDLSLPDSALEIYNETQKREIEIDILINNAGIGEFGHFADLEFEKVRQIVQLNMIAVTELTSLYLKEMTKRRSGKIMNVSSLAAFQPGPWMSLYYASKAYIQSLSEAIAVELEGTGVTMTVLCPGPTKSDFQKQVGSEDSALVRLNLMSSSEEVAKHAYKDLDNGKMISIPGVLNNGIAFLAKIFPSKAGARIVRNLQEINRK